MMVKQNLQSKQNKFPEPTEPTTDFLEDVEGPVRDGVEGDNRPKACPGCPLSVDLIKTLHLFGKLETSQMQTVLYGNFVIIFQNFVQNWNRRHYVTGSSSSGSGGKGSLIKRASSSYPYLRSQQSSLANGNEGPTKQPFLERSHLKHAKRIVIKVRTK